jgi:Tfp pilus assembly protein PilX
MKNRLNKNKGTALVTGLVLLLALTVIALSGIQTSSIQLLISSNDETTIASQEFAQSIVDAIIENPTNFKVGANNGYTRCTSSETCDDNTVTLTSAMFSSSADVDARIELLRVAATPRMAQGNSANVTQGAYFSITGKYDNTSNTGGKANVVQGYVMVLPTGQ